MNLLKARTTAIAYETVEDEAGRLPLLKPMSAVAGNMAAQVGAYYLAKFNNGKGEMLGEVVGVNHGKVMVIGDGIVGQHAARMAYGMGAKVSIFTRGKVPEKALKDLVGKNIRIIDSNPENISKYIKDTDVVVGAVLVHGAKAPKVVTEKMVKSMQPGSVIVDVAIDQGGSIETSRPTTHSDPVFMKHGVVHYCVANMPGAYPRTSTIALTNATLPYLIKLTNGLDKMDSGFKKGINTYDGFIAYKPVAEDLGMMDKFK